MILNLRKIKPVVKPIVLCLDHKEKRDAIRAKLQSQPKKRSLMVSISLKNDPESKPVEIGNYGTKI